MKAKRRHELHQNALDAELHKIINFFKRYGTWIGWGALIVALVVLIVVYLAGQREQRDFQLRQDLNAALSENPDVTPEDRLARLDALAAQTDSKPIAVEALMAMGDTCAGEASLAEAGTKRDSYIDRASEAYSRVVAEFAEEPVFVAKAHVGLAKLAETRRDFQTARAEYNAALAIPAVQGLPVQTVARQSLGQLSSLERPVPMATTLPTQPAEDVPAEPQGPAAKQP